MSITQVVGNKFHRLCYELGLAFESTFSASHEIKYSDTFAFPDLVYKNPNETVIRVHCPAWVSGDILADGKAKVCFVPWVDNQEEALFHRLCFRIQPVCKRSNVFRKLMFARFGEQKAFGFDTQRKGGNGKFITLQFFGYGNQEFVPLYLKIMADDGQIEYYKISAQVDGNQEEIVVEIEKVSEKDAPGALHPPAAAARC